MDTHKTKATICYIIAIISVLMVVLRTEQIFFAMTAILMERFGTKYDNEKD